MKKGDPYVFKKQTITTLDFRNGLWMLLMVTMMIMVKIFDHLFVALLSYLNEFLVFSSSLQNLKSQMLLGFAFFADIGHTRLQ